MTIVNFDLWQDKARDDSDFPDGTILAIASCRRCGMVEKCKATDFESREQASAYFADKLAQECGEYEGNTYEEKKKE